MNWHDDVRNGSEILTARHALPGHRAFTEYASSDARIDLSKLKKVCGNKFPSDPVEQNRTWYRLYKTVEGNPAVSHVHRDFLLMRDYAGLAALFMIFFGTAALIEVPSWRASLTYCFVLLVCNLGRPPRRVHVWRSWATIGKAVTNATRPSPDRHQ